MEYRKIIIKKSVNKCKVNHNNHFSILSLLSQPIQEMDKLKLNIANTEYCVLTSKLQRIKNF